MFHFSGLQGHSKRRKVTDLFLTTLMLNQITQRRMECWVVDNDV